MNLSLEHLLLIAGMALVTYIPRMAPLLFLSSRSLNQTLVRWLELIPPAVLAAILLPELCLRGAQGAREFNLTLDNVFLLAALPTFFTAWLTRSFFGTVAVGMLAVALLRFALS